MCKEYFLQISVESILVFIALQNYAKLIKNTLYTCKQPLMMASEGSESARDNFSKFIHQFQLETKILIQKYERVLFKLYKQNVSLQFN